MQDPVPGPECPPTRHLWLRNKSVAVKNLVVLAIWEWMSLWLVIFMVSGTAIYNGFIDGGRNPDRYPRLVLILIYAVVFLLHFVHTWTCFCRTYTNLVLNGCWTLLSNSHFAVKMVDKLQTSNAANRWAKWDPTLSVYESSILGSTSVVPKYRFFHTSDYVTWKDNTLVRWSGDPLLLARRDQDGNNEAPTGLVELQDVETKIAEKATEVAMERIILNATILLSISVVTGFSTWTQSQLLDATSAQLGSLALLASTASGIAAMLSSAQHLNGMASSSWRYLEMTELIISGKNDPGVDKTDIGFTKEAAERDYRRVTLLDFWRAVSTWQVLGMLIFGPAFVLLPFGEERRRTPLERPFQIDVALGESRVFFSRSENEKVTVSL